MFPLQKIFIFILFLNIIPSLISFSDEHSKSNNEHSIIFKTFEELDKLMSHSEFNKVWENFRENIKKGEINNEFISEELKNNEKYEFFENTNNDEIILGSTNSDTDTESCLMPKEETAQILKDKYGINDNNPQDEVRFITGKCHPVILIPGMLSTKLQVRINCDKLYKEEKDTFKKIRFYCGKYICHYPEDNYNEEHDLFISGLGYFGVMSMMEDLNKYSGCLGYFLTFFNTKDVCSPNEEQGHDKYVCNYSKYIKIGYYGSTEGSKNNGRCGLNAIQNVVMAGGEFIENMVNTGILRSYKPLIEALHAKKS